MNRLTRLDTVFNEAPVYFITACTEKRGHLLANDDAHEAFRRFCSLARKRGVRVGRYVLMPDHLHSAGGHGLVNVGEITEKHAVQTLARARHRCPALAEGIF